MSPRPDMDSFVSYEDYFAALNTWHAERNARIGKFLAQAMFVLLVGANLALYVWLMVKFLPELFGELAS